MKLSAPGIFRGGYITDYYKVALPNYMVHLPNENDVVMEMDVDEELNDRGNGGDSDDDVENLRYFNDKMRRL